MKESLLVVCVHNSARSQMAEEFFRLYGSDIFDVESAGIEPGTLNPLVVKALALDGIDISSKATKSAFDLHAAGRSFDLVITVCDSEASERCPVYPGTKKRLHWPFSDPSSFSGNERQRLAETIRVKEEIQHRVKAFVDMYRKNPQKALEM